tara:strand:- start:193 stop:324 length:132 start_codon:yes stop_codon:yes gene_type:complete
MENGFLKEQLAKKENERAQRSAEEGAEEFTEEGIEEAQRFRKA